MLLCPWDSPGKDTGAGCPPGDLSNPGIEPAFPYVFCIGRQVLDHYCHLGSPSTGSEFNQGKEEQSPNILNPWHSYSSAMGKVCLNWLVGIDPEWRWGLRIPPAWAHMQLHHFLAMNIWIFGNNVAPLHKSFGENWRYCIDVISLQRRFAFANLLQTTEYITGFLSELEKASHFFHILALQEPTALGELRWLQIYFYVLFRFFNCPW